MQKEPIIAIIIGSLVGLGVAFGVWQYSRTPKNIITTNSESRIIDRKEDTLSPQAKTAEKLSVLSPNNYDAFNSSDIKITGLTDGNAILVVLINDSEYITTSNSNGEFEIEVELEPGINQTQIKSITDQSVKSENLVLLYSEQVESDQKLTSILGSITDISENAIQVTTPEDIIEQISIDENASFANIISTAKDIEFEDIAIGDFVIGIGVKDSNIYNVYRLLVAEPVSANSEKIIYGDIVELSSSNFLVNNIDENIEYSVDATGKINVTKFDENGEIVRAKLSDASDGEMILIIGTMEDELIASRIHIFPIIIE